MTNLRTCAALAALALAACTGAEGPAGPAGSDGSSGGAGAPCTVTATAEGGATITCPDGTSVAVAAPGGCTIRDNGDGTKTVSCEDGTGAVVTDGVVGRDGVDATRSPGTVSGTVVDAAGRPLAGATVVLTGSGVTGTSGADGTFRLAAVPAGVHPLTISHPLFGVKPFGIVPVDSTETTLGALRLQAGELRVEGHFSSVGLVANVGERIIAERLEARPGSIASSQLLLDLATGESSRWGWSPGVTSSFGTADLQSFIHYHILDWNLALCAAYRFDVASQRETELALVDCNDVRQIDGRTVHGRLNDWSGLRGDYVLLDLAAGSVSTFSDRAFWTQLEHGAIWFRPSDGALLYRNEAGVELTLGVSVNQIRGLWVAPGHPDVFWLAWNDGTGTPALGRFDAIGGGLTIVVADLGAWNWGDFPLAFGADGSAFYFGPNTPVPGVGEFGALYRVGVATPPEELCASTQFGNLELWNGGEAYACRAPPAVPGEPPVLTLHRGSDGAILDQPGPTFSIGYEWLAGGFLLRWDSSLDPTPLDVVTVATGEIRRLSDAAQPWSWWIMGDYVLFDERDADGVTLHKIAARAQDLHRAELTELGGVELYRSSPGRVLFTDGVESWLVDLDTGATVWRTRRPAFRYAIGAGDVTSDEVLYLLDGRVNTELAELAWLDLDTGDLTVVASDVGLTHLRPDGTELVFAVGWIPGTLASRTPGLYAMPMP